MDRGDTAQHVGEATWFISHTWSNAFADTLDAVLLFFEGREDAASAKVWIDVMVTSQHGCTGAQGRASRRSGGWARSRAASRASEACCLLWTRGTIRLRCGARGAIMLSCMDARVHMCCLFIIIIFVIMFCMRSRLLRRQRFWHALLDDRASCCCVKRIKANSHRHHLPAVLTSPSIDAREQRNGR